MSKHDEWTRQAWKLNYVPTNVQQLIWQDPPATNQFRLKPIYNKCCWFDRHRRVIGYRVTFEPNMMNQHWKDCSLIRRGSYQITSKDLNLPVVPPDAPPILPLLQWSKATAEQRDNYSKVAAAVLTYAAQHSSLVKRIEADLFDAGQAQPVQLYRLPDAIKDSGAATATRALLVLNVVGVTKIDPVGAECGIAHGDDM